jgi:hypothetical protein
MQLRFLFLAFCNWAIGRLFTKKRNQLKIHPGPKPPSSENAQDNFLGPDIQTALLAARGFEMLRPPF